MVGSSFGAPFRSCGVALGVLIIAATAQAQTTITGVGVSRSNGGSVLTVEADGPLPVPVTGAVDAPPRIFIDLAGVRSSSRSIRTENDPVVRRVRVALNSVSPVVTRIVLDLFADAPYTVDANERAVGRLRLVVGRPVPAARSIGDTPPAGAGEAAAPPPSTKAPAAEPLDRAPTAALTKTAPPAPAAAAQPSHGEATGPAVPSAPSVHLPPQDVQRYLRQAAAALDRIDALRPILASIDARATPAVDRLQAAAQEVRSIQQTLDAVQPPRTVAETHDLLLQACRLAGSAISAARESVAGADAARSWNAASAAAGSMMLLDRVHEQLGRGPADPAGEVGPSIDSRTSGCSRCGSLDWASLSAERGENPRIRRPLEWHRMWID